MFSSQDDLKFFLHFHRAVKMSTMGLLYTVYNLWHSCNYPVMHALFFRLRRVRFGTVSCVHCTTSPPMATWFRGQTGETRRCTSLTRDTELTWDATMFKCCVCVCRRFYYFVMFGCFLCVWYFYFLFSKDIDKHFLDLHMWQLLWIGTKVIVIALF